MMIKYLTTKNETYWYRRKIKVFGEIVFSLQTKNYNEALVRHSYIDFKIKTMLYKGLFKKMTVDEIRAIIEKYKIYMLEEEYNDFEDKRDEDLSVTLNDEFFGGHTKQALGYAIERYKSIHQSNDIDKIKEETSKILQRSNLQEDYEQLQTDKEKTIFHWELLKAEWELLKNSYDSQNNATSELQIQEQTPQHSQEHYENLQRKFQGNSQVLNLIQRNNPYSNNDPSDMSILELTERYIKEKRIAKDWGSRNEDDINGVLGMFAQTFDHKTINQLTREDFSSFRDIVLKNLPKQRTKTEFKDKSLKDILQTTAIKGYETISITTINKHLGRVHQIFEWAYNSGYIERNLSKDLELVDKKKSKKQKTARIPYSKEELKKLFEQSPWFNQKISFHMKNNPEYIFIPLIALFTGAKPTELAQLKTSAIKNKKGILGIDFNQMIKGATTERFTPLSETLIDLGFLKYVQFQKKNKSEQLFPAVRVSKDNGTNFTNAFSKYNREFISTDKEKSFYSLRHLVNQQLKNHKTPTYIINDITGHSQDVANKDEGVYGDEMMPEEILQEVINECLVYDFLDLSKIKDTIKKLY